MCWQGFKSNFQNLLLQIYNRNRIGTQVAEIIFFKAIWGYEKKSQQFSLYNFFDLKDGSEEKMIWAEVSQIKKELTLSSVEPHEQDVLNNIDTVVFL